MMRSSELLLCLSVTCALAFGCEGESDDGSSGGTGSGATGGDGVGGSSGDGAGGSSGDGAGGSSGDGAGGSSGNGAGGSSGEGSGGTSGSGSGGSSGDSSGGSSGNGSGGSSGDSGGSSGSGGSGGSSGSGAGGDSGSGGSSGSGGGGGESSISFFVTSYESMAKLSGNAKGFGGDLGGLSGADKICQQIGASVHAGHRTWRAFLSATDDGNGSPVNAMDRIGKGPWEDANGRVIAKNKSELSGYRPAGDTTSDLPDEFGQSLKALGQGHDIMTGSNMEGELASTDKDDTCNDWTSSSGSVGVTKEGESGGVYVGHSWPSANSNWMSTHGIRGCARGYIFEGQDPVTDSDNCVGCSGGYGAIYCFAAD